MRFRSVDEARWSPFDLRPIGLNPSFERRERLDEGPAEFGELVQRGRLDSTGVEVAHDKTVALGSSEGVGHRAGASSDAVALSIALSWSVRLG